MDLEAVRDFGYGSGSDIQGGMTLYLGGDLSAIPKVVYYMDNEIIAEVIREPFKLLLKRMIADPVSN